LNLRLQTVAVGIQPGKLSVLTSGHLVAQASEAPEVRETIEAGESTKPGFTPRQPGACARARAALNRHEAVSFFAETSCASAGNRSAFPLARATTAAEPCSTRSAIS
jgi:hypothetical protein